LYRAIARDSRDPLTAAPERPFAEASMTVSSLHMLAFGTPGPMEMLIVGMVVLLLFGNRLPSVMRSLGVGITEFKKGIKGEGVTEPNASLEDQRRSDAARVD
jgi:sec-independent protein translocase protein TatA